MGEYAPQNFFVCRPKFAKFLSSNVQHKFTDIDYADDFALLVDKEESFHTALAAMDEEASKFCLRVSWTKTKIQNLGSGPTPVPVTVDGNTVDPIEEFTYLGSIQSSRSNSGPEYIIKIGGAPPSQLGCAICSLGQSLARVKKSGRCLAALKNITVKHKPVHGLTMQISGMCLSNLVFLPP